MKRLLTLALIASAAFAQGTAVGSRTYNGAVDMSAATSQKPRQGAALPSTCATGETFLLTSSPYYAQYFCSATNTWKLQAPRYSSATYGSALPATCSPGDIFDLVGIANQAAGPFTNPIPGLYSCHGDGAGNGTWYLLTGSYGGLSMSNNASTMYLQAPGVARTGTGLRIMPPEITTTSTCASASCINFSAFDSDPLTHTDWTEFNIQPFTSLGGQRRHYFEWFTAGVGSGVQSVHFSEYIQSGTSGTQAANPGLQDYSFCFGVLNGGETCPTQIVAAGIADTSGSGITPAVGGLKQVLTTPASSSAACEAGQSVWDASYLYICTANSTWKRAALSSF